MKGILEIEVLEIQETLYRGFDLGSYIRDVLFLLFLLFSVFIPKLLSVQILFFFHYGIFPSV